MNHRQRQQLLSRIERRFEVVEHVYSIGPLRVPFVQVVDPDKVLDDVAAEQDRRERNSGKRVDGNDLHLPYWAQLWDSAVAVASHLIHVHRDLRHDPGTIHTLDLGCGQGLSGLVAAMLGHQVLLADIETDALLFARLNTLPYRDRARTRRLNWQMDRLAEQFDFILGADVLYEKLQWDYLEPFWQHHLKPDGVVILGEPGRQTGDLFIDWIATRPWSLTRREERVPGFPRPIRLFELRKKVHRRGAESAE